MTTHPARPLTQGAGAGRHRLTHPPRIDPHTLAEESRAHHDPGAPNPQAPGTFCPACNPLRYVARHKRRQVG